MSLIIRLRAFTPPTRLLLLGLLWMGLLPMGLVVSGCGCDEGSQGGAAAGAATEEAGTSASPEAAIKGMLAYAEAGDWGAYVSTYYGEAHKMTQPEEQTKDLAARLEKVGPKLIETLKGCLGQEPKLSEDGNTATYPNAFRLYRDDGKWGFHL